MKYPLPYFLFALILCAAGCATHYDMKLTNGMVITAKGKPRVDSKNHLVFFKDAHGNTNVIPEFRVVEIARHSDMEKENNTFKPVTK